MMAHSFSKASLFLSSGNLLHNYNTKSINDIHGLIKTDPFNAYLLLFAFLSLIGIPPFPIFISEFMMIKSMLIKSPALTILFVSLLTIVIAGMAKNIFKMLFGEKMITNRETHAHALSFIPQIMFLICLLISGIYLPSIMHKILTYAAFSI